MITMKNIRFILVLISASFLMASSCTKEDDAFYNSAYITVPNLVMIETQTTYNVGDILWINTDNFSRYLNEPNQTTPLDVRLTTQSDNFRFVYGLEKQTGDDTWEAVNVNANFNVTSGIAETGNFVLARAVFDASENKYQFRGGITLTNSGSYRIVFGSGFTGTSFDLTSDNATRSSTYLTISTSANNTNGRIFNFTVN